MLLSRFSCALLVLSGLAPAQTSDAVLTAPFSPSEAEVFGHVRFLASDALRGRASGSAQGEIAATYIAAEMAKLGLDPAGDEGSYFQAFERMQVILAPRAADADPNEKPTYEAQKVVCRNVLAWLPGSEPALADEFVLVGAHYDHLGTRGDDIYNGADDNASGVAGMLGVARALVHADPAPRRSILFVAFDAEERGLAGAEHFARKPPRSLQELVTMINLDMIGRARLLDRKELAFPKRLVGIPDGPAVGVLGTTQSPELAAIARAVFTAEDLPLFAPEDFGVLASVIEKQAEGRSDHAPFERRKIPFLFFSTSEHDDYHQPTDTIDKVDGKTLWRTARCVFRTLLAIDASDARPTFVPKVSGKQEADASASGKEDDGR